MQLTKALAVGFGLAALSALAGPLFPYQGRLDLNGRPVNNIYSLKFTVWDAPVGGNQKWTETFAGVPVVGGAFSVKLGSNTAIDPANLVGGPLFVAVDVQGPNDTAFIPLAGRQQLLHTPFASASQQDFAVQGRIGAGGVNPSDAGVSISAIGPTSNGSTVGVLRLSSDGGTLIADGQSIDSSGTLQLQSHSAQPTAMGGPLTVAGPVTAPNTWVKLFDGPVSIAAPGQNLTLNGLRTGTNVLYRVSFTGTLNNPGGNCFFLLQVAGVAGASYTANVAIWGNFTGPSA